MSDEKIPNEENKVPVKGLAIWILLAALFLTFYTVLNSQQPQVDNKLKSWSEFKELALQEDVKIEQGVQVTPRELGMATVSGKYIKDPDDQRPARTFEFLTQFEEKEKKELDELGFTYTFKPHNPIVGDLIRMFVPILLLLGILYFFFIRQMKSAGKGAMSFGKSRAKLLTKSKNKLTFEDVAGLEEAREEVSEIVDFLKDPKKFQRLGGHIPKGVLLVGPPGTGKTLLARAIAGEAEVPFFSISGSDFVEMFVGVGASRVRDMFEQGRKSAPCIIFIDEIDAVGRSRFSGIGGGNDEREQTLNALLVEMDGFDAQEGIIIVAATNRPDVLDKALLRPGRFDRQIHVDLPTMDGREEILAIHTQKIKLHKDVKLSIVARGTPGFSGADLANLVNEAALLAARRNARSVEQIDIENARDKVAFGVERKSRMPEEEDLKITAYHEAGHAILMAELPHSDPVHKVTVIPRGQSLGSTMQLPLKDEMTTSQKQLESRLIVYMGGRAAEEIVIGDVTTGAAHDLQQASRIARLMVMQFGMCPEIGPQALGGGNEPSFGRDGGGKDYSEATAQLVDDNVKDLLKNSYDQAMQMLLDNREAMDIMADELIKLETITGEEVNEIIKHKRILTMEERREMYPDKYPEPVEEPKPEPEPTDPGSPSGNVVTGDDTAPPYPPPETSPA